MIHDLLGSGQGDSSVSLSLVFLSFYANVSPSGNIKIPSDGDDHLISHQQLKKNDFWMTKILVAD